MGFRYTVRLTDGSDGGEVEYSFEPAPGDTIRLNGNRPARVVSVIPLPRIEEFVDAPEYAALEVELLS